MFKWPALDLHTRLIVAYFETVNAKKVSWINKFKWRKK